MAQCGIGKVFAAICAQTMILRYGVSVLINTGVAGTLSEKIGVLDFAVSTAVVQHDMDTSALGDLPGLISGINIVEIPASKSLSETACRIAALQGNKCAEGIIASGDQFICHTADKTRIKSNFEAEGKPVIACEMEGAAIGQVCYVNRVPYAILRAISDGGDEQAFADYPTFLAAAAETATRVMLRFVENWP